MSKHLCYVYVLEIDASPQDIEEADDTLLRAFITRLYRNFLLREPETDGIAVIELAYNCVYGLTFEECRRIIKVISYMPLKTFLYGNTS